MNEIYAHPQEVWDEKTCAKRARTRKRDGLGTQESTPGRINSSSSVNPGYGQTTRYNGGCFRNGEHYKGESVPFPKIPDTYEFYFIPTWGHYIRRKVT